VVTVGELCACKVKARREADARRPSARERGYDTKWQKESRAYLEGLGNPLCVCGCGRKADMVDHIEAHKGDKRLFWSRSNWQPYNRSCNSRKAARSEGGFGRKRAV
jgi:5-methylcytosine-specific restriction protein A